MAINFYNEDIDFPDLSVEKTESWINDVILKHNKVVGDISFIFCSDPYLLKINKEYLNHDYFTDIITFNYCEGENISGDIFISLDTVKDNSVYYNTQDTELLRVVIHGILHLIGFDDHTDDDKEEMRSMENDALAIYPA